MERLMARMGRDTEGAEKRVLELNPSHGAVKAIRDLFEKNPQDARVEGHARLLLDEAVIAEGSKLKDPAAFARRINELLVADASR